MKSNIPHELRNEAGIYEIVNTVNGKRYVGCTSHFRVRIKSHKYMLGNSTHHNKLLMADYYHYGSDSFEFNVLEVISGFELMTKAALKVELQKREVFYIKKYNTYGSAVGYNACKAVGSSLGAKQARPRQGLQAGTAKHSLETICSVKILIAKGWSNMQIVQHLNLKPYMATVIRNKRAWGHLEVTAQQIESYVAPLPDVTIQNSRLKLNKRDVEDIKKRLAQGEKIRHVARLYGVDEGGISLIKHGRRWVDK